MYVYAHSIQNQHVLHFYSPVFCFFFCFSRFYSVFLWQISLSYDNVVVVFVVNFIKNYFSIKKKKKYCCFCCFYLILYKFFFVFFFSLVGVKLQLLQAKPCLFVCVSFCVVDNLFSLVFFSGSTWCLCCTMGWLCYCVIIVVSLILIFAYLPLQVY